METIDVKRRFGGVARLYGDAGLARLQAAHAIVIGLGGVGSWAVEALARNAVGKITLIDLDNIAESNVNRQIHALDNAFGQAKVTAMAARIKQINPLVNVVEIEDFITPDNLSQLLAIDGSSTHVVVDCIDDVHAKTALAIYCKQHNLPLLMAGSAGGLLDPTRMQVADLARVYQDKLLGKVRHQLRRHHGFPKANIKSNAAKFGITCVFSDEPVIKPDAVCDPQSQSSITGLNCTGFGSSVSVTAPLGFTMAHLAIQLMLAS